MSDYAIPQSASSPAETVKMILQKILSEKLADALFVTARTPYSPLPMPGLFTDPEKLEYAAPLAPAAPFNAARQASAILRTPTGKKIALVLRPCEIRALIELVKLKQCSLENTVLIGMECFGRMENAVFLEQAGEQGDITASFYKNPELREKITASCHACIHFLPRGADLTLCTMELVQGGNPELRAETDAGRDILQKLGLTKGNPPKEREKIIADLQTERQRNREKQMQETAEKMKSMEGFQHLIANCLNCYNCRVACPVCYCKECVFVTDVFAHDPDVLLRRAAKKGWIKLPTDTTMFHMTRMAHMSHACVACGHCSSVCPSHIPVADMFSAVAAQTQSQFGYEAGRNIAEPIPYLIFEEKSKHE